MKKYYLFEIEANGIPIYDIGEWETSQNLTNDYKLARDQSVVAYGEVEDGKYVELFEIA